MDIKIWGVRGSISAPGPQTNKYGGNSSSYELRLSDGNLIILDAGTGIRQLGLKLMKEKKPLDMHLLLSHGHMDHVHGFPFFGPAYIRTNKITVVGCVKTGKSVKDLLKTQMGDVYFPVEFDGLPASMDYLDHCSNNGGNDYLEVHKARIYSHGTNHPGGGVSYKIVEKGKTLVYMTDNELMSEAPDAFPFSAFVEYVKNADVLFHDTQYTPNEYDNYTKGWGHSRYTDVARLVVEAGVKKVVLIHHDPKHNDRKVEWIEHKTREEIKKLGGKTLCVAGREGMTVKV